MKKKLEADLISIAHRILKLKNKSDINQLYLETQKLYEKLAVLKFVDENFDTLKPTIGHSDVNAEIETIFEKEEKTITESVIETPVPAEEIVIEAIAEPEIIEETPVETIAEVPEEILTEVVIETPVEEVVAIEESIIEKIEEPVFEARKVLPLEELSFTTKSDSNPIPDFKPAFEIEKEVEKPKQETATKADPVQISFEDLMGINYADAQFVKVDSFESVPVSTPAPSINEFKEETIAETAVFEPAPAKTIPLNEKLAKGFHIDLNDRIAFTKNLFANNTEDYSRVLNQLLTFDNFSEAQEFIETMVKPDYNNWEGKDDYAERFLGIVEKKFS